VSIHRQFRVLVEDDLDRLCPSGLRLVAHPATHGNPPQSIAAAARTGPPGIVPTEPSSAALLDQSTGQTLVGRTGVDALEHQAAASGHTPTDRRVLLAVGPEGGWNAFELRLLEAHGFQPVDMGPRTLRTDTACIALLALLGDAFRFAAS
jgi:hypothetical protein